MEEKIRQYVNYRFRFDRRPDVDELKEEIIANLIDRYHEKLNEGKMEEEAYREAIQSMGNFSDQDHVPYEYSFKPSLFDLFQVIAVITSVFSVIATLLSITFGTTLVLISMLFFGMAAYYFYSYSQYVRKEELDIPKHHLLLRKIFRDIKTNFVFWAISLSIIFTHIIMKWIQILTLKQIETIDDLNGWFRQIFVIFIFLLLIFAILFRIIYKKLMWRYTQLTGEKLMDKTVKNSLHFVFGKAYNANLTLSKKTFYSLNMLVILTQLIVLFMPGHYNWVFKDSYVPFFIDLFNYFGKHAMIRQSVRITVAFEIVFTVALFVFTLRHLITSDLKRTKMKRLLIAYFLYLAYTFYVSSQVNQINVSRVIFYILLGWLFGYFIQVIRNPWKQKEEGRKE